MTKGKETMLRMPTVLALFFLNMSVFADAYDGEYLGYRLGEKYTVARGVDSHEHIMGAKIIIVDPGRQSHHIDSVSIFVSPKSSIVGSIFGEWYFSSKRSADDFSDRYLSSLETKYNDWKLRGASLTFGDYQLWVEVEEKPPVVDHWPSKKNFRVAIGLIFAPDSLGRSEWMARINREVNNLELTASE